ncbi:MAG: hypothetical protein WAU70_09250 [Flavobacteriales bacterium]
MAYKINQPPHPDNGKFYEVIVEGDVEYVKDGDDAVYVDKGKYVLPYKKADASNTQTINVFTLPYRCVASASEIEVELTAQAGSITLGGPKKMKVHDAT